MSQIFKILVHFPKAVLAIFTALTLFFAYYSTKLEIDASSQTLLLEHDKDLEIWREVSKRYESPNFLVIAYTPNDDLLSQNSLNKIRAISNEIRKFDFVDSVLDITSVPLLQNKENRSGFKKSLFLQPIIWYNALTKGESQILKGDLL